jgi:hypothetical protein
MFHNARIRADFFDNTLVTMLPVVSCDSGPISGVAGKFLEIDRPSRGRIPQDQVAHQR